MTRAPASVSSRPSLAGGVMLLSRRYSMMRLVCLMVAVSLISIAAAPAESRLADAFRAGDARTALASLAAGGDVNTPDSRGYTPLMWAASWGSLEGAEALLQKGAKVNTPTPSRKTAIVFAVENGHTEVAKRLLAAGANLVMPDPTWSARQAAKTEAMQEVAQRAIELGDLLMAAVSARDSRRVSELTAKGAPLGYTHSNAAALQVAAAQHFRKPGAACVYGDRVGADRDRQANGRHHAVLPREEHNTAGE